MQYLSQAMEYLKHLAVGTPLERTLKRIRARKPKNRDLLALWIEERSIEALLPQILKNDSNCIDVGCHLGSFLSEILRVSPHGSHIAFEPLAYKAAWLRKKFPRVQVHELALSDRTETVAFFFNRNRSGFSGLSPRTQRTDEVEKIEVQCKRLDDVLPPEMRIDFIKIDVEGAVLPLLQGSVRTLRDHRPKLLMECTVSGTGRFGHTVGEVYDFLGELDYQVYLPKDLLDEREPLTRPDFESASVYPPKGRNFFATT